ncbi:sulfatase [Thalassoglobus sp. JC818]|uniref:sulfatase family protein n=1 Tax=Thalassoglobus sp. JC818 TaxID=3232136 RepID=UPI00345A52CF
MKIRTLLLMSLLSIITLVCGQSRGWSADQPNILFIIADDASRDSFGAYGANYVKTPNFDRIASEGVLFSQAYNCNPKCSPARACLLTGRYSWQLEEACNHQPFLSEKWQFYPWILKEQAGYSIGYTGKGWGPGIWQGNVAGKANTDNPAGPAWNKISAKPPYKGISNIDYAANFTAFLDSLDDDAPFCFWLGTKEPHRGYELDSWKRDGRDLSEVTVPDYFPDTETIRGDLADYAIEVEWFDTHIGRALEELQRRGRLENTLIIATSDHGMPFPRVKGQIYDDGFHVPFAVRWGDRVKAGRTVTDFITFPDVAPTILEVAGVAAPDQVTGQSFLPQLLSEESGRIDPERNYTLLGKERHDIGRTDGELLSVGYPSRAIRTDDWLYVRNFKPQRWPVGDPQFGFLNCDGSPTKSYLTGLTVGHEHYHFFELAFGKRPEQELYAIEADPDCVKNLAVDPQHVAIVEQLWNQLQEKLEAQGDPRINGNGEIFDFYPNRSIERQQQLYKRPDWNPVEEFERRYGSGSVGLK